MKRFLISAAAVAALSLSTLCAQSFDVVRVTFDKDVEVAGTTLPAGEYTITMLRSNGDAPVLRFQGEHGTGVMTLAAREFRGDHDEALHTSVVLDKSGPVEQVTRIEIEGSSTDYVIAANHHNN